MISTNIARRDLLASSLAGTVGIGFASLAKPLAAVSGILETLFGAILLIAGSMQAYGAYHQDLRSDTLLAVPQFWPLLAFPIGGLAILLQGVSHILRPRLPETVLR